MLRIGGEKAQPREQLVDGSVLKQAKLRVCNTAARDDHIHLDALSGMGHLLIRLWLVSLFGVLAPKYPAFASRETGFPDNV